MAEKEYIERGAVLEKLSRMIGYCEKDKKVNGLTALFQCGDVIMDVPAADVVEVVHGEWIDKPTGAYRRMQSWCSACGKHSGIGGIESNRHKPHCPNCGAKMDGGKNETD